jgi:polar amino acid transport system substrate-binding protein
VKRGDADFLQFVNTALREAMAGVDFAAYKSSFERWFGVSPPEPQIGFPSELR